MKPSEVGLVVADWTAAAAGKAKAVGLRAPSPPLDEPRGTTLCVCVHVCVCVCVCM